MSDKFEFGWYVVSNESANKVDAGSLSARAQRARNAATKRARSQRGAACISSICRGASWRWMHRCCDQCTSFFHLTLPIAIWVDKIDEVSDDMNRKENQRRHSDNERY